MSLRRSNVLEQDTGSEVDEDDVFDEHDFMEQDGSSETESDIESSQMRPLIKVANGTARDLKKNAQDEADGSSTETRTVFDANQDITIRNGSVYVQMNTETPDATDVHRYKSKTSGSGLQRKAKPYPREMKKVCVAVLFVCCNFMATAASLSIIHEYFPLVDPLPDQVLDSVPYLPWGLKVCEVLLTCHTTLTILVIIFHKHRFIVMRRVFLILGLLYGYRAITMFVTVLPKADKDYFCSPKMVEEGKPLTFLTIVERSFTILSGFGLTINGKHTYCGDYIFSGHTMMFVLTYLVIQEYTNRRFFILHWALLLSGITGVVMLLCSRGHYTIDCILAYYITTRIWYIYHSMACHQVLKRPTKLNYFVRLWWWHLFHWFEENVRPGPLPNGFSLPLNTKLSKCLFSKSRDLVSETSKLTKRTKEKFMKHQEA